MGIVILNVVPSSYQEEVVLTILYLMNKTQFRIFGNKSCPTHDIFLSLCSYYAKSTMSCLWMCGVCSCSIVHQQHHKHDPMLSNVCSWVILMKGRVQMLSPESMSTPMSESTFFNAWELSSSRASPEPAEVTTKANTPKLVNQRR